MPAASLWVSGSFTRRSGRRSRYDDPDAHCIESQGYEPVPGEKDWRHLAGHPGGDVRGYCRHGVTAIFWDLLWNRMFLQLLETGDHGVSQFRKGEKSWLPTMDPTNSTSKQASRATRIPTRSMLLAIGSNSLAVNAAGRMSSM